MNHTRPKWPLWLWGLQLLPAGSLLALGLWIMNAPNPTDGGEVTALAIAGGIWFSVALTVLLIPGGRRWLIRQRAEWGLSAVVVILCLVVVDVLLTVTGLVPTIAQQRRQSLSFAYGSFTESRLTPRTVWVPGGEPMQINRRGFRGPEIAVEKQPGESRIVFLGGSQVFDYWNVPGWPAMVGEELERRHVPVEIINAAVPGHDSTDSLGKLMTDLWTLSPDVIVLCNAWNDTKRFRTISAERPYRGLPPREPRSWNADWRVYPTGLDWFLSASAIYRYGRWWVGKSLYIDGGRLGGHLPHVKSWFRTSEKPRSGRRSAEARTTQFGPWGPRQYRLNLELIAEVAHHVGAALVICRQAHLATKEGTDPGQEEGRAYGRSRIGLPHSEVMRAFDVLYQHIEEVAAQTGALVVDMDREMSGRTEYFVDGIHFSLAGSRAAATLVAEALEPLVVELVRPGARRARLSASPPGTPANCSSSPATAAPLHQLAHRHRQRGPDPGIHDESRRLPDLQGAAPGGIYARRLPIESRRRMRANSTVLGPLLAKSRTPASISEARVLQGLSVGSRPLAPSVT